MLSNFLSRLIAVSSGTTKSHRTRLIWLLAGWIALFFFASTVTDLPSLFAAFPEQGAPLTEQPQVANAAPDLVIASITLTPANPGAGGTADVEVVVLNQGDASTSVGFNLYLYVEPADDPPTQSTAYTIFAGYALPLPPGGTFKYIRTGQIFNQTAPKVYAWVDPPWENKVAESNEDNNLFPPVTTGGDDYEDDNTCANAKEITPDGTAQERNLHRPPNSAGDIDWIKFNGVGGTTYLAEAIAIGADASLAVELHARCDGRPALGMAPKWNLRRQQMGSTMSRFLTIN